MSGSHLQMYFKTEDAAQSAAVDLKALGATEVSVDFRGDYAFGVGSEANDPEDANLFTLGAFPAGHTSDPAPASVPFLLGGYTERFNDEDENNQVVLTALVEQDQLGAAASIMQKNGGHAMKFDGYGM
ncbi:hypothetical protein [Paenibacillus turpanensis]|uniref:hypothetical protein n=1 Tax=Paenibacillus turpanensis TaxID=2689078 RepID=UPI00140C8F92|nr:hypothetical protein [Paenibacillus turpanensis]